MTTIKNCKAFVVITGKKKTLAGKVKAHLPFSEGKPEHVIIKLNKPIGRGKNQITEMSCLPDEVRIVPKHIPPVWKKILKQNAHIRGIENVGVCFVPHTSPECTTLFHKKTGETLQTSIVERSSCKIKLWVGDPFPSESKLEVDSEENDVTVGNIRIYLEDWKRY
jgi:hypothetical protein